ncbi:MAG: 50S ribosomal protein L5 [Candidatus Nanohaloarchaeota archaeon]|nr:50S ribosomal protein L5 [Candidatus Nanohaloarchaeota archaeon]
MSEASKENIMRKIRIEKVTLNIGVKAPADSERAYQLLEKITGRKPVYTKASRKARTFKVRRGLPIGAKVTLRGEEAKQMLLRLVQAKGNKLSESNFDENGNFGFGIAEYLDIPGIKYDPQLGVMGLDVFVNLERPGFRVRRRKYNKSKIGKKHRITKKEAIVFVKEELGIIVE